MKITDTIKYVGVNDHRIDLFEGQYKVPGGMSYNSYVILDEKIAVMDTVDADFTHQWLDNIQQVLDGRKPDYLIVQHMEPDHAANVANFLKVYPDTTVVATGKAFGMIRNFFELDLDGQKIEMGNGGTLSLGYHQLTFVFAPMVHWPEVMVTYDSADKVLFSADGFGKFGALDVEEDWACEARRYYIGIVGKYGVQVQNLLKKAATLDIQMICPLHGPVWRENLEYLLSKYDLWSRYVPEDNAVAIFYASMYGDTENAANILAAGLAEGGIKNIALYDVSVTDVSVLIAEAFRCSHLVFAAPTYNNGVYPAMYNFLHDMGALSLQNRTIGLIENGTWGPVSAKQMQQLFSEMKQMNVLEPVVTVKSSVKEDSLAALCALKDRILASCTK